MSCKANGKTDEELLEMMEKTILAYDNMCYFDFLSISRKDLPLPAPFNKMWQKLERSLTVCICRITKIHYARSSITQTTPCLKALNCRFQVTFQKHV